MDRENNDVGVIVRKGKYGGALTHKDIVIEFGSASSVPFKLYLIMNSKDYKLEVVSS